MSEKINEITPKQSPDGFSHEDNNVVDISNDITRPSSSNSNTLDIPSTGQEDEKDDDER